MTRRTAVLALALALPLAAAAQAGQGAGPGMGMGPGKGMGPGGPHDGKRAKLALTLGLAEVLDLDDTQALKLRTVIDQFEQRRAPLQTQQHDAMKVVRSAADGEKVEAAAVDQALAKVLDARAKLQALDRELVTSITKDLPPQKKARAVLFLGRFHERLQGMGPVGRRHQDGRMMGPGLHRGPRGAGMGPGMGPGAGGDEPVGALDDFAPPPGDEPFDLTDDPA